MEHLRNGAPNVNRLGIHRPVGLTLADLAEGLRGLRDVLAELDGLRDLLAGPKRPAAAPDEPANPAKGPTCDPMPVAAVPALLQETAPHRKILHHVTAEAQTAQRILRQAGYAYNSASRKLLSDLVKLGRVERPKKNCYQLPRSERGES